MPSKRKIAGKHVSGFNPKTPSKKKNNAMIKSIKRRLKRGEIDYSPIIN